MIAPVDSPSAASASPTPAARDAYQWLRALFVVLPVVAGLTKFTDLIDWSAYLWSGVADVLPMSPDQIMMAVGVVEVLAGILVAIRPRIGALVIVAWLGVVIVNLLLAGDAIDVVARDVGLGVAALTLARLAEPFARASSRRSASS